jgi:predicted PurR-regulated permease PerM
MIAEPAVLQQRKKDRPNRVFTLYRLDSARPPALRTHPDAQRSLRECGLRIVRATRTTSMSLRTIATGTALAVAALIVVFAFDLVLLLFAAVLIAVVLDAAAALVMRLTSAPRGIALALVFVAVAAGAAALVGLVLPSLLDEIALLRTRLPEAMDKLQEVVNRFGWVETIFDALPTGEVMLSRPGIAGRVSSALTATVSAAVNIVVVFLVAMYLTASPQMYIDGVVRLFPKQRRRRAREVFTAVGDTLLNWLRGQLIAMTVVGLVIAGGLFLLGIPLAGTLGLIAGLFEFVPNIGPILAGVPAALLAITVSSSHVFYVIVLFIAVQTAESYLLTPLVMKHQVALPPALTIVAQVVATLVGGWLGLLLATPLTAALLTLVQKVYLESALGEDDAQAA